MDKHFFLLVILFFLAVSIVLAQQEETPLPVIPSPAKPAVKSNPAMLMRLRGQLAFELQQTQRTLGFVDPNDVQLVEMLKTQQAELTNQLKDITAQLSGAGAPVPPAGEPLVIPDAPVPEKRTAIPTSVDSMSMPNPFLAPPAHVGPPVITPMPQRPRDQRSVPPTQFDQDQAWSDSPWSPQPSKELTELKQTVESLRKDVGELKETVKALETQIQLLNRNILLSLPKTN
jgi:hypothetical protein